MLYIYGAIVVAFMSLSGYNYYLKSENEIKDLNIQTLKANEKAIISAYEHSVRVIEIVSYEEGLNVQSAKTAESLSEKIDALSNKRGDIDENTDTTIYDTSSF